MKKFMLISALGFMLTIISSCKKDWDCQCVDQNNNVTNTDIKNETLLNARSKCKSMSYSVNSLGASESCSLQ